MEQMYQDYKDLVEFRLVYIREAHAADTNFSGGVAHEFGINEHQTHAERCEAANLLLENEELTIPCLIDDMWDAVSHVYSAHPDRVYLVGTDGRLAIAGKPGPGGLKPGLVEVNKWLSEFRQRGSEPGLPPTAVAPGEQRHIETDLNGPTNRAKASPGKNIFSH